MLFGFLLSRAYMFKLGRKGILFPILCISWEKEPEAIPMAVPSSAGQPRASQGLRDHKFLLCTVRTGQQQAEPLRGVACTARTAPGEAMGALWKGFLFLSSWDPTADGKCSWSSLIPTLGDPVPGTKCLSGSDRDGQRGKVQLSFQNWCFLHWNVFVFPLRYFSFLRVSGRTICGWAGSWT